jgi:Zn-dependent peptidase ImmA (M78 family)
VQTRRRGWYSRATRLVAAAAGADDPVQAMELLATDLLEEAEQTSPPVNLSLVASFRGVVSVGALVMRDAGALVSTPQGLKIFVNARDNLRRQNFTVAHETCHTFFPGIAEEVLPVHDKTVGSFSGSEEELLCDIGASCIILPLEMLRPRLVDSVPSLSRLIELADEFEASLEATAVACAGQNIWNCAVIFLEEKLKPSQERLKHQFVLPGMEAEFKLEPELRITLACQPGSFPTYLPRHKSVDRRGPICLALLSDGIVTGTEVMGLQGRTWCFQVEALRVPYRKDEMLTDRVIAMLRPLQA